MTSEYHYLSITGTSVHKLAALDTEKKWKGKCFSWTPQESPIVCYCKLWYPSSVLSSIEYYRDSLSTYLPLLCLPHTVSSYLVQSTLRPHCLAQFEGLVRNPTALDLGVELAVGCPATLPSSWKGCFITESSWVDPVLHNQFFLLAKALKGWLSHGCEPHIAQKMFKYGSCATVKTLGLVSQYLQRISGVEAN